MTLISIRDLENSAKISQLLSSMNPSNLQSNINFMLQNASVTKASMFTSAMLQQLQLQSQASQMCNKNMILSCLSSMGSSSSQAQVNSADNSKSQINSSRYKTELCRQFIENGGCKYGEKCQFAHGMDDLKDVNRHPKYKTDYCKTFHSKGFCPYGPRCHFIHELNEKCENPTANKKVKGPERPVDESKLGKYCQLSFYIDTVLGKRPFLHKLIKTALLNLFNFIKNVNFD